MMTRTPITLSEEVSVPRVRMTPLGGGLVDTPVSREVRYHVVTATGTALGTVLGSSHDGEELITGWLLSQRHIGALSDIQDLTITWSSEASVSGLTDHEAHVTVTLAATPTAYTPPALTEHTVPLRSVLACAHTLDALSKAHHTTHGVHEAAIVQEGQVVAYAEDVARHNVLDRLFAQILTRQIDPGRSLLVFSGRVPYSVITKVRYMGFPILLSRTAPTTLSIAYADAKGITLVNHLREDACEVFTHPDRITEN